jgi:hypothetical protein
VGYSAFPADVRCQPFPVGFRQNDFTVTGTIPV